MKRMHGRSGDLEKEAYRKKHNWKDDGPREKDEEGKFRGSELIERNPLRTSKGIGHREMTYE